MALYKPWAGTAFLRSIRITPRSQTLHRQSTAALSTSVDSPAPSTSEPPPPSNPPQQAKPQPVVRIIPKISPTQPPTTPIPNHEPYTVSRTPSSNLSIYQTGKRGGNLKITSLKKVSGNVEVLRKQLEEFLTPKPEYVRINPVNGHVVMKGWYKTQIENYLGAKGF